jgi:sulfide:quinone oxidoreductase
MAGKKIVVVGGGLGGVAAARTARAMLGLEHDVLLLDRNKRTYLCGSFPLLIIGEREASKVSRSLGSLAKRGVRHLQAEVEAIDTVSRTVKSSEGTLDYDFLVLAPGAAYDWDAVPESSSAYSFYDLASARRLRRKLAPFRKGPVLITVASVPYKCPPAPFEAAMTLDWDFPAAGGPG